MTTSQQHQAHSIEQSPSSLRTLRLMTCNLWAQYGLWPERRSVLRAGLALLKPDLIAFQEAIKHDTYDQIADLLEGGYHIVHRTSRTAEGSGGSIASRWPIDRVHEVDLHHLLVGRAAAWISQALLLEIRLPEPFGPLLMMNYPTSWQLPLEHAREQQAVAAAQVIEEIVGQRSIHVVVAGDFNASPEASSMRFWRGLQSLDGLSVCYTDTWERANPGRPGHTFTARNLLVASGDLPLEAGRRIDYILVRCRDNGPTLDTTTSGLAFDQAIDGVWASDHFAVVADVQLPSKQHAG